MRECAAALIVEGQKILLGRRSAGRAFYPSVWDVFGGHLEPRETYEQALVRELGEELGITPTAWARVATVSEPDPDGAGVGRYVFFLVTAWDGTPSNRQPHEHDRVEWFSLDQAVRLDLAHPAYRDVFARVLTNKEGGERGNPGRPPARGRSSRRAGGRS